MKNKKGFTLIELIIILALLSIILPVFFSPITFSLKSFFAQEEKTNIIADTRVAMDYLTRQIRKSSEVVVVDEGTIKIDLVTYKIEDRNLTKDSKVIVGGIDKLKVAQEENEITITIGIKDGKGKEHSLSSVINLR